MKPPFLTVLVIAHNRPEYTERTIDSLKATLPHSLIHIWINGNQELYTYLFERYLKPAGHLINFHFSDDNPGWGTAINRYMKIYGFNTDYILISNNDVEYHPGWYEKCLELYEKYPKIGIMGVWGHTAHGIREDHGDLLVKDNMPAVGWLLKKSVMDDLGPIAEHGPCSTKGGNGEDTDYVIRAQEKGYWVACPKPDVGIHLDGY